MKYEWKYGNPNELYVSLCINLVLDYFMFDDKLVGYVHNLAKNGCLWFDHDVLPSSGLDDNNDTVMKIRRKRYLQSLRHREQKKNEGGEADRRWMACARMPTHFSEILDRNFQTNPSHKSSVATRRHKRHSCILAFVMMY